ncbi:MAG: hypothetical protein LBQ09_06490 [Acidobacteriaceae bacterium]|nr:hypothetical protein [Acidobacteriaceae bacterium]
MPIVRRSLAAALVVGALVASGACAHARVVAANAPPLETPEAPPRVVSVSDPAVPVIVSLPEEPEPVRTPPPPPRVRPTPPRAADAPRPPATPDATVDPASPQEPPRPVQTLQTTPTQQEQEMERQIRATLTRAASNLNTVNYQRLNADGRTQYETAKRFIDQADEAIRGRNLVFASNLAEKASALAAELAGR